MHEQSSTAGRGSSKVVAIGLRLHKTFLAIIPEDLQAGCNNRRFKYPDVPGCIRFQIGEVHLRGEVGSHAHHLELSAPLLQFFFDLFFYGF